MWTIDFEAHGFGYADEPEKIVGKITAVWNAGLADECSIERQINMGDPGAIDEFIADAKKIKAKTAVPDQIAAKISAILARLNEK